MKRFLLIALAFIGLTAGVLSIEAAPALAASAKDEICSGVGAATGTGGCTTSSGPTVNSLISTIVNILSMIVGVVAVIMIIYSGFKYVSSGGDSSKISSAKNSLIYAVVGLAIAATAQVLVRFVLDRVT